jgi:hypothetical protein
MRLWSIHPKYMDTKGLLALWREALLAKHVLEGKTKGYKNHPQLNRFKATQNPIQSINQYLSMIYNEANLRGYDFNKEKINWNFESIKMNVTKGQMEFEKNHLLKKLIIRDIEKYNKLINSELETHPMFEIIDGKIEDWEIIK